MAQFVRHASRMLRDEFVKEDVLESEELRERRRDKLYIAVILGTNFGRKVRIKAAQLSGDLYLSGVLLAQTDQYVIFTNGDKIPVRCIAEVDMS